MNVSTEFGARLPSLGSLGLAGAVAMSFALSVVGGCASREDAATESTVQARGAAAQTEGAVEAAGEVEAAEELERRHGADPSNQPALREASPQSEPEPFPDSPGYGVELEDNDLPTVSGGAERGNGSGSRTTTTQKRKRAPGATPTAPPQDKAAPVGKSQSARQRDENQSAPNQALGNAEAMLTRLDSLEGQLRGIGVRLPQDAKLAAGAGDAPETEVECSTVCELAEAICELELRICGLASAHPEDDRYANACTRAGGDCKAASEACNACD